MASSLILDLSTIDLSAIAVCPEEVGLLNPQCGDMRQLDHVVWLSPKLDAALGVKRVRPDEFWVEGHIPGRPLYPGVLMIEASAQLCSVLFKKRTGNMAFLGFIRCEEFTFRGQVRPGDVLYVVCQEVKLGARRFVSSVQGVCGDSLVFDGRLSGMVL